ncbi:helix-turn-helix transcriptional regulator, partial [Priestia megaterium]|uniref:helix-turn-helix transcriptional regulator n=1 Tax=Priestia megaterium TaxID=1404 RepID=UPI00207B21BD
KEVFELALDGLSSSKMAEWLFKERSTISQQRKDICKKLGVKNIKEAVQKFQNLHQEPQQKIHPESPQKLVNISQKMKKAYRQQVPTRGLHYLNS